MPPKAIVCPWCREVLYKEEIAELAVHLRLEESEPQSPISSGLKTCRYCGCKIPLNVIVCPDCDHVLDRKYTDSVRIAISQETSIPEETPIPVESLNDEIPVTTDQPPACQASESLRLIGAMIIITLIIALAAFIQGQGHH
jgi:hypothetical protein